MSYQCDICNNVMPNKSAGTFFDENRVVTSPYYWEYLIFDSWDQKYWKTFYGRDDIQTKENVLALFLARMTNDTSGFTVCNNCRTMLEKDIEKAKEYGIEKYVFSDPSGQVDSHSAGMVAGTIWKRKYGKWPSSVKIGGGGPKGTLKVGKGDEAQKTEKSGCFIATAAYGTPMADEIQILRNWRDYRLSRLKFGAIFIEEYYRFSPPIAKMICRSEKMKGMIRFVINPIIKYLEVRYKVEKKVH